MMRETIGRLLIVDDEEAHLQALCETLEAHGYDTTGFSHPEAALAAVPAGRFDLLLTDLRMPGMDGIELLRAATQADPALAGVIMTGEGSIGTAVEAMKSGALDYILKPFRLKTALPVLARALEMRFLRLRNEALQEDVRRHVQELETANRDLEAFAHSVSHDLRAPLHAVSGFSYLLASRFATQLQGQPAHYVERISSAAGRMGHLIEGLLRLSRLGVAALDRRPVDIVELAADVIRQLREERVILGDWITVEDLPHAFADAVLLRQVFVNLLVNACKFGKPLEEPRIAIGFADGEYFVRDAGEGFDAAKAEGLFEPFRRFGADAAVDGHGVGLSIVRRIVEKHGGRVRAESAPGEGACFLFTLPAP